MALLLVGVACYSIADSAFAYLTAQNAGTSLGNLLDTGWFAGFLMIALAAIYPPTPVTAARKQAPLDLWQLALPWMTLLTASAGDFFCAITGRELDLLQTSLTATLALFLTVNMIIERKEFLEMLTEIQESHTVLQEEFRSALVGIKETSAAIRDGRLADLEEARRLAAEIHAHADSLDRRIEQMVSPEEEVREKAGVAVGVAVASREVVPEGAHS